MPAESFERETDWGMPLPGDLLPAGRHSDTHLKRLPLGRFDAEQVFGRRAPLLADLGCGKGPWPDAPTGRTRREILARQLSLPVFRALCRPRADLDRSTALREAEHLPLPRFDANRRLLQAEEHEASLPLED